MSDVLGKRRPPSDLTAIEAWERALTYRLLARKMPDAERRKALTRLAEQYEKLAMEQIERPD